MDGTQSDDVEYYNDMNFGLQMKSCRMVIFVIK